MSLLDRDNGDADNQSEARSRNRRSREHSCSDHRPDMSS